MIRWMIDEGHLDDDDDPTIGLKSGKAKASRESGGFLPWTEEDMALYRATWPLGTEARLMFDILHYTFLRLGDAHRFGPPHLRQIVRKMAVQIATEKSRGNVTVPVHPEFAESLRAARAARTIGVEVFAGKRVRGQVLPMNKKAWAGEVQEVRGPGRRQRAQEKLPWGSQSASRGRGLCRLHGEPDDGDVRLDRSEDAGALHRAGEPGKARNERHGQDCGV
jgi:integrase